MMGRTQKPILGGEGGEGGGDRRRRVRRRCGARSGHGGSSLLGFQNPSSFLIVLCTVNRSNVRGDGKTVSFSLYIYLSMDFSL